MENGRSAAQRARALERGGERCNAAAPHAALAWHGAGKGAGIRHSPAYLQGGLDRNLEVQPSIEPDVAHQTLPTRRKQIGLVHGSSSPRWDLEIKNPPRSL